MVRIGSLRPLISQRFSPFFQGEGASVRSTRSAIAFAFEVSSAGLGALMDADPIRAVQVIKRCGIMDRGLSKADAQMGQEHIQWKKRAESGQVTMTRMGSA